jgi:hypothetical protein
VKFPFHDEATGHQLEEHLFYGFGEDGEITGERFATREACVEYVKAAGLEVGTKPKDLSNYAVVVLSGGEYAAELLKRGLINEKGEWL